MGKNRLDALERLEAADTVTIAREAVEGQQTWLCIAWAAEFARAVIKQDEQLKAAKVLADAVDHERNLACQDFDMQMDAAKSADNALAAFRIALEKEKPHDRNR